MHISTEDLTASAVEEAVSRLRNNRERGAPAPRMGPYLLVVPLELEVKAARLLTGVGEGSPNNDKHELPLRVEVDPSLTSPTGWLLKPAE